MLLKGPYFPAHEENRMQNEGDIAGAREAFNKKPSNLVFLLEGRYHWMNEYCDGAEKIIELGSGAGLLPNFINNPNLKLTDYAPQPWIDVVADALNTDFEDASIDIVICSHMIHHVATPVKLFKEVHRILKPGGKLLIVDLEVGFSLRAILRIMRHEGWSYDVDVFDENTIANDPADAWSANCAIPHLLFKDEALFTQHFPNFKIIKNEVFECFLFLLSGGVNAKVRTINLPRSILKVIRGLDSLLVKIAPSIFAMGRKVVLEKS